MGKASAEMGNLLGVGSKLVASDRSDMSEEDEDAEAPEEGAEGEDGEYAVLERPGAA